MGLENPIHLAIIAMIALLVFGAKRLPDMGRSLGHGMRGFKDALTGEEQPAAIVVPVQASMPVEDETTTRVVV